MKALAAPLTLMVALAATAAVAEPVVYDLDPGHSQILFSYEHLGFSTSTGVINGVTGKVTLDADNPANSSVEANFDLANMVSVAPDLDKHLRTADFFGENLTGTFKSTSVAVDDEDEAKVTGDLTINGVTKPVTLEVDLKKKGQHPMSGKEAVGFEAETEIKRSDFNLGAMAPAVSDEVEIKIAIEASAAK